DSDSFHDEPDKNLTFHEVVDQFMTDHIPAANDMGATLTLQRMHVPSVENVVTLLKDVGNIVSNPSSSTPYTSSSASTLPSQSLYHWASSNSSQC
ncbi:hypothetical protein PAXRUDRAFT_162781, partial [Paxillus rubicundulus Ve08.2h10]